MISNDELIVDNFAGGGGASTAILMSLGREPDVAINHDPEAIAMHVANHPRTKHYCKSIYQVDPDDVIREFKRRIGLAHFSPDCTHHSKARGGVPRQKHIRDLAWVVVQWAERAVYKGEHIRVITVENVEEFQDWGPLDEHGKPCPVQKGAEFKRWVNALRKLGYKVEWRELRACDYGAPTSRKRLFVIARCDGEPIVWPKPTHGPGRAHPFRTAAECIDWRINCPSIFLTTEQGKAIRAKRPLADATMRRVAHGLKRFVLDAQEPFIVNLTHQGGIRVESLSTPFKTITSANGGEKALVSPYIAKFRGQSPGTAADAPLHTITAGGKSARPAGAPHAMGLVSPTLIQVGYGERDGQAPRALDLEKPLGTVVSGGGKHAVVAAYLAQQNGDKDGRPRVGHDVRQPISAITGKGNQQPIVAAYLAQHNNHRGVGVNPGHAVDGPISSITAKGSQQGLVTGHMVKLRGTCKDGQAVNDPLATISAQGQHLGLVTSNLIKYYGTDQAPEMGEPLHTVTSKDRFGVVQSELRPEPLTEWQESRAREVAALIRKYGLWDDREFVTLELGGFTYVIVDIGLRMLTPPELFAAQGFPAQYIIAPIFNGKPLTKTAQVRMCGNSVSPPPLAALLRANFGVADDDDEIEIPPPAFLPHGADQGAFKLKQTGVL